MSHVSLGSLGSMHPTTGSLSGGDLRECDRSLPRHAARAAQLAWCTVATSDPCKPKGSKAMVMDFNKSGVYSFTDWCDQKQRFKTVKHNLSGAKACLPDQHHTPCHQQAGILHIDIGFSHRHCYFTPMSSAIKFTSHCNYMDTFPTLVTLGCMRTRVLDRALIEHSRHVNSCTVVESQLV